MPTVEEHGFAVLRRFICRGELQRLKTLVDSAASSASGVCERPNNTLLALRWNDAIVDLIVACEGRMRRLQAVLSAEDLKWISGYISIKSSHSGPLWWHQDWWCWDHPVTYRKSPVQVAVLCYLCDTTQANGALRILPGSHLRSSPIHALLPEAQSSTPEGPLHKHPAMIELAGEETIAVSAGDAVVIDYRVLHATHANSTEMRRDCVLLSFAPAWRSLPNEVKAHLVQHPAQASPEELTGASLRCAKLLPTYDGERKTLTLNRNAPPEFWITRDEGLAFGSA
ncbi:MAG TPA: phytanoyl-CoA dioxygenase family protein [Terriglobales bacterium]|nr:phytanoyl-CoA dioxygenase family protein [Terriglobales bacterium]